MQPSLPNIEESLPLVHIEMNYYSDMQADYEIYIGGERVLVGTDIRDLNTVFIEARRELLKYINGIMQFPEEEYKVAPLSMPSVKRSIVGHSLIDAERRGVMSGMEVIEEPVQEE